MSTPSANTRSSKTPTSSSDGPQSQVELQSAICVAISDDSPEFKQSNTLAKRRELLSILMNPTAHKDEETRREFSRKLSDYFKAAGFLNPHDILNEIAIQNFDMRQFKVVIVGDAGVGKSAFVSKHAGNPFKKKYDPTQGAEVTHLVFLTSNDYCIKFVVWDTAGVDKNGSLRDGYYIGSVAAVLMYDVTSKGTYNSLTQHHKDLTRVCGEGTPIVVAGNKADVKKAEWKVKSTGAFPRKHGLRHLELSAKLGKNFNEPFLHIARMLTGDKRLRFVTAAGTRTPEIEYDDDVVTSTCQLSLEDRSPPKRSDVAEARALSLPPPSKDDEDGL